MGRLMCEPLSRLSRAALLIAAGGLAGCSSYMPDFTQFKVPTTRSFLPENMDTYVPPASARADRPVSATDLVDAQGFCAGIEPTPAAAPPSRRRRRLPAPDRDPNPLRRKTRLPRPMRRLDRPCSAASAST